MNSARLRLAFDVAMMTAWVALTVAAAPPAKGEQGNRSAANAAAVLPSDAMKHTLRADRDKDGVLSRAELDEYDRSLARHFKEADGNQDGKLTLTEFEGLIAQRELSASRR